MRMGLAIDASCDLPQDFLKEHDVAVMPIAVRVNDSVFKDDRSPAEIDRFLRLKLGSRSHSAETEPCSVEDVQKLFLEKLVLERDCVFCLTITATRSPIYDHVIKASFGVLKNYRQVREPAGISGPFLMRVMDTRTLFAGTAPCVFEAVRLMKANETPAAIRERLAYIAENSYGYMLPRDLYYLRARAKKKGDRSVGLFSAVLGSTLDIKPLLRGYRGDTTPVGKVRGWEHGCETLFEYAAERVRVGLLVPVMCTAYGGDLAELPKLPGYNKLVQACQECNVTLMQAPMSITGMVNVGEGAVCLGFAAEEHEIDF